MTVTTAHPGPATPRPHAAAAAAFTLRWRAGLRAPGRPLASLSRTAASGFSLFFLNLSPLRKRRQVQLLLQPGMEAHPHRVWGPRTLSLPTPDGGPGHYEAARLRPRLRVCIHTHLPARPGREERGRPGSGVTWEGNQAPHSLRALHAAPCHLSTRTRLREGERPPQAAQQWWARLDVQRASIQYTEPPSGLCSRQAAARGSR